MRAKLLLTGLLFAAVVHSASAQQCTMTCMIGTNPAQPACMGGPLGGTGSACPDGQYTVQATVTQAPMGMPFSCGEKSWLFRYDYTVKWISSGAIGPLYLTELKIPSCFSAFCAVAHPATSPVGDLVRAITWTVNQDPNGGTQQEIDWMTTVPPTAGGMPPGSTWTFTVFSNNPPAAAKAALTSFGCTDPINPLSCRNETSGNACTCTPCPASSIPPGGCEHKFNVAQVYPATPIPLINYPYGCWMGGTTPTLFTNAVVPGVLCLNTDPNTHLLNLNSFLDPACCASPTVQFVTLTKIIPGSRKCPDTYPPQKYIQMGTPTNLRAIRTWWPLMYSMPGTTFTLQIQGLCHDNMTQLNDVWTWTVVANPQTFRLLIDWLHTSEIDLLEVPCIVGQDTYAQLVACADQLSADVATFQMDTTNAMARIAAQNDIFNCEALILCNAFFTDFVNTMFPINYSVSGPPSNLAPPAPAGFPTQCGVIGILDSFENPCACKMITDLESIGIRLGITSTMDM